MSRERETGIIHGDETDAEPCGLDFGFGLDEDVATGSAAFSAFAAQKSGDRIDLPEDVPCQS